MIEIHSIYGLCIPPDMELADIENGSISEVDTPGMTKTNVPGGDELPEESPDTP